MADTDHNHLSGTAPERAPTPLRPALPGAAVAATTAVTLSACGGGNPPPPVPPEPPVRNGPSATEASRFLAQASMGASRTQIARVQALGYAGWLDEQFSMPASGTRWDWLTGAGFAAAPYKNTYAGTDACQWRKLLAAPDTLRQRVTLALSEIVVLSVTGTISAGWYSFSAAAFLDLLEAHAFGNYRKLLEQVSLSAPMGEFLTYRNNLKANPATGSLPDENYAREIMQLFSIGLVQLHDDGRPRLLDGKQQETYTQQDIMGLARVFTGWAYDYGASGVQTPELKRRPMRQVASGHESGSKMFLGTTIRAGVDGAASLTQAIDTLFGHPNVAPFIGRQLIQRLVCSNPSPAYVGRVSAAFNNDGKGVKGNLQAVLRTILLDPEARDPARLADPSFGKLREPILRLAAWARAFTASSPSDTWALGNTSDPGTRLGQSPLRAQTVFNFFTPGYVPPYSAVAQAALVAPEFQIANEATVIGYLNFMQTLVSRGIGDVRADYSALLPLADNARALVDELNLLLAAGQLSSATVVRIKGALDTMPAGAQPARLQRIHAAIVLVLAAPEFLVQK